MDEKGLKLSITEKGKEGKSKNDYVVQISGKKIQSKRRRNNGRRC